MCINYAEALPTVVIIQTFFILSLKFIDSPLNYIVQG